MGSVKDLEVLKEPSETKPGIGIFTFSDRYSVFDWGEMPDHILYKGASLCRMAAHTFEKMERDGIPTHYLGLKKEPKPCNRMIIQLVSVINPEYTAEGYDYSFFRQNRGKIPQFLVPLEIVFRNGLPEGSSVLRKLREAGKTGNQEYIQKTLQQLGLTEIPHAGTILPKPVITFATKLEPTDRDLAEEEAFEISGLTDEQWEQMMKLTIESDRIITDIAESASMKHYDGKVEFVYADSRLMVADVAGTFDENRFMVLVDGKEVQVSKEFLRQWYRKNDPEWVAEVEKAKNNLGDRKLRDVVKSQPRELPSELSLLISQMYTIGAGRYAGREVVRWLAGAPDSLEGVMRKLMPYME